MEGRDEDLRCHIYQIRGAASWVCADRLLGATEELMRAYQERKCCDELEPQVAHLVSELERVCREIEIPGSSDSSDLHLDLDLAGRPRQPRPPRDPAEILGRDTSWGDSSGGG